MHWSDNSTKDFEPCPPGPHPARCVRIIDIGTRKSEWQGKPIIRRQCVLGWELPTELMTEGEFKGQPFMLFKFYTASLSEKANLRKDLELWRGKAFGDGELKGFHAKNLLGKTCMLSVIHDDKGKARVAGVMQLPKSMHIPDQVNPSVYFSLDEFDQATFDTLTPGFKRMVEESPEYVQLKSGSKTYGEPAPDYPDEDIRDMKDDLPF